MCVCRSSAAVRTWDGIAAGAAALYCIREQFCEKAAKK